MSHNIQIYILLLKKQYVLSGFMWRSAKIRNRPQVLLRPPIKAITTLRQIVAKIKIFSAKSTSAMIRAPMQWEVVWWSSEGGSGLNITTGYWHIVWVSYNCYHCSIGWQKRHISNSILILKHQADLLFLCSFHTLVVMVHYKGGLKRSPGIS